MSNAQHSASTGEWYTPPEWVELVRSALGGTIDLDPCSSYAANSIVQSRHFIEPNGREVESISWRLYGDRFFVNPPGTCVIEQCGGDLIYSVCGNLKERLLPSGKKEKGRCSCKLPQRFLKKSIEESSTGATVIYLAYSVNQLRQLSKMSIPECINIALAIPSDRIAYLDPTTMKPKRGTNCDSAFICITSSVEKSIDFAEVFRPAGCAVYFR